MWKGTKREFQQLVGQSSGTNYSGERFEWIELPSITQLDGRQKWTVLKCFFTDSRQMTQEFFLYLNLELRTGWIEYQK